MTRAEAHVKRSVIEQIAWVPMISLVFRMKGQVLHRERAHLKAGCSLVSSALQKLPFLVRLHISVRRLSLAAIL